MNETSVVSLSTRDLLETHPDVRASVEFYSQFTCELGVALNAPSSGTVYPTVPSEWRDRMLAVVGIMDTE